MNRREPAGDMSMNRAREATTVKARRTTPTRNAAQGWKPRRDGLLFLLFPLMLVLTGLEVLLSGRDLTQSFLMLERETQALEAAVRHPAVVWVQRGVSLLLLMVCFERIVSHFMQRKPVPSPMLTSSFLLYWITTVAVTALMAPHPRISHEYLYPLMLGLACSLCGPLDRDRILASVRNALYVFMLAGVVLVFVNPSLVLDTSYTQGLIPGLPRFGGLTPHPVMMGMLAEIALVMLWVRPFRRGWLNLAAWMLGLGVMFVAQSKTAWLCFVLSACCLIVVRRGGSAVHKAGDPRASSFGVTLLLLVIVAVLGLMAAVLVFDLPTVIEDFFNTSAGMELASLTGRDRIWVVAMEEWGRNPVFGYGLTIWDADYRQAIGMPQATHAHNQFLDTLSRSGLVGAFGLVIYALVLTGMAFRYARATGGLSLALYVSTALLCISEVPLLLIDYGSHVLTHFLLIVTVASGAAIRVAAKSPQAAHRAPIEPTLRTAA
jgi:O-antigen ligase